jgi:SAM-dependent methyltransferase
VQPAVVDGRAAVDEVEGARSFRAGAAAYDAFMGRYSAPLAVCFADAAGVRAGQEALDVGSGPGALTSVLVERLGPGAVSACDPSPSFVAECAARHPGVDVRPGRAEALPFPDGAFDHALAQLVLHFVSDPMQAAAEACRVVRPGGTVSACVWDFTEGMEMLRRFWDSALAVRPDAPDEARTMRFGRPGELVELFAAAGVADIVESTLTVTSTYLHFDELWAGFLAGIGPAGSFCVSLSDEERDRVRQELFVRLGSPTGQVTLTAVARCATGRVA